MKIIKKQKFNQKYNVYKDKFEKFRLCAKIFEDKSGEYEIYYKGLCEIEESGTLYDWISEIEQKIKVQKVLLNFLKQIEKNEEKI